MTIQKARSAEPHVRVSFVPRTFLQSAAKSARHSLAAAIADACRSTGSVAQLKTADFFHSAIQPEFDEAADGLRQIASGDVATSCRDEQTGFWGG